MVLALGVRDFRGRREKSNTDKQKQNKVDRKTHKADKLADRQKERR